jgi:hypothetical protein
MNDWSDEQTEDPLVADVRNFYKVEKWTRDGMKVDSLLYAAIILARRARYSMVAPAADQIDHSAENAGAAAARLIAMIAKLRVLVRM